MIFFRWLRRLRNRPARPLHLETARMYDNPFELAPPYQLRNSPGDGKASPLSSR